MPLGFALFFNVVFRLQENLFVGHSKTPYHHVMALCKALCGELSKTVPYTPL